MFFIFTSNVHAKVTYKNISELHNETKIVLHIDDDELIYADSLTLEVDHPSITIVNTIINPLPVRIYDAKKTGTKHVYKKNVTIAVTTTIKEKSLEIDQAHLHISFFTNKQTHPIEIIIPLHYEKTKITPKNVIDSKIEKSEIQTHSVEKKLPESLLNRVSQIIRTTHSLSVQLIFAFFLGLLLSLTPCIYPMIPITVGILHNYGTKSFYSNMIRSILYAMGIATTYALFGLLASCTGPLCSTFLTQPIFIYAYELIFFINCSLGIL